jgi:hypothetical protein
VRQARRDGARASWQGLRSHLLALCLLARSLFSRSLLGSRAMASVDVSRVVALANKAVTLECRGHCARAAEVYAEAVTAAQALHQPDCVIVAYLQAARANPLLGHANTAGVPAARHVELMRMAFLDLLPAAMASLERRLAAGTLRAGACRPHEVAWYAAKMAHDRSLAANVPNAAVYEPSAAEMSARSAHVGYEAYMITARIALHFCAVSADSYDAQTLNLPDATAAACSAFVASAFDTLQLRTGPASISEAGLVRNAQTLIDEQQRFGTTTPSNARILTTWRRLQSSGMLQRRGIAERVGFNDAFRAHAAATAAATAAAHGLRVCALGTCGAQEVHASQFKRCSACLSVAYCCKEHQVQDWRAHKAACRAARKKAGEEAADETSGA